MSCWPINGSDEVRSVINRELDALLPLDTANLAKCVPVPDATPDDEFDLHDYRPLSIGKVQRYLNSANPPGTFDPTRLSATTTVSSVASHAQAAGVSLLDFGTHSLFQLAAPMLEEIPVSDLISQLAPSGSLHLADQPFGAYPLAHLVDPLVNVSFGVNSLTVSGLDSLTSVQLFTVLSPHVFQSRVAASHIHASAEMR